MLHELPLVLVYDRRHFQKTLRCHHMRHQLSLPRVILARGRIEHATGGTERSESLVELRFHGVEGVSVGGLERIWGTDGHLVWADANEGA